MAGFENFVALNRVSELIKIAFSETKFCFKVSVLGSTANLTYGRVDDILG